jgi:hypothetical protein
VDALAETVAQAGHALGPITVEWQDAVRVPGHASRPARFWLRTQVPRPPSIGGGYVSFSGMLDLGGNTDWIEDLNTMGQLVARAFTEVGWLLACVHRAYQALNTAREQARRAEEKMARTLTGGRIRGRYHVALTKSGQAWLQDPEKRDVGFGLRFESLGELWRAHPELRPVAWGADERGPYLTLEPFPFEEESR